MFNGMNDTEGLRCLEKAEAALRNQDFAAAERLSQKALRMLSSEESSDSRIRAQAVYRKATSKDSSTTTTASSGAATSSFSRPESNTAHRRRAAASTSHPHWTSDADSQPSRQTPSETYSRELEDKCRRIMHSKDYYQILGVSRDSSGEDIKKAYRKLALLLHPDKAKCPSAEAAFKVLAKAYQCLTDPEAKKHYDIYGADKETVQQQAGHATYDYESHFMSPEDLFESFFGVQFFRNDPHSRPRVFRVQRPRQHPASTTAGPQTHHFYGLLQILPLLIIVFVSLFSNLFNPSTSPPFSFSRSPEYSVTRVTREFRLPYYVKSNFHRLYAEKSDRLHDLESQIEMSYFLTECNREQQPILQQLQRLQFYGTSAQYKQKAEELRRKEESSRNCRNYRKLKARYPYQQPHSSWS